MTVTPAMKARTRTALVAITTAIAIGNVAARVHPKQEDPVAVARGNSGLDPEVGHPVPAADHPVPVIVVWSSARTGGVRRRANPALTAKVRNVLLNTGPRQRQLMYRLFPKRNASQ